MVLTTNAPAAPSAAPAPGAPRPVVLLLPGQGAQRTRMAAGLYDTEPVFTAAMDALFDALGPHGRAVRDDWLAGRPVDSVGRAQPLLLGVNHALGRMVLDWGIRPALLGHSVGELSAAVLAGVLTLHDAARLLRDRVRLAAAEPPGGMLAVAASVAEVEPHLGPDVAVGAVNAPRQTVLAGLDGPLDAVAERLRTAGYTCRRIPSPVAFHSPALAGLAAASAPLLRALPLRPPALPLYSAYTGGRLDARTATDPEFWGRHPVDPVLFWPALERILADRRVILLDASPGQSLSGAARRHPAVRAGDSLVAGLLPRASDTGGGDRAGVAAVRQRLRAEGHPV
jgi:acyl transferase domain-containing protein